MKGFMTRTMLQSLPEDFYEYLVARHMWHKIRRKAAKQHIIWPFDFKRSIAKFYKVAWWSHCCWLCERHVDKEGFLLCEGCPLRSCTEKHSPYFLLSHPDKDVRLKACDDIIAAIDEEWRRIERESKIPDKMV